MSDNSEDLIKLKELEAELVKTQELLEAHITQTNLAEQADKRFRLVD